MRLSGWKAALRRRPKRGVNLPRQPRGRAVKADSTRYYSTYHRRLLRMKSATGSPYALRPPSFPLPADSLPTSQPSPSHPLSFRLASTPSSSPSRAYLATHLRFASVAQLQSAVGTLEAATRVGELVRSLKRLREGEGVGEGAGTKRRKKGMAGEMTLDELFAGLSFPFASFLFGTLV